MFWWNPGVMKMNTNISLFSSKTEGTGIERTTQISYKKWPSTSKERMSERRSSHLHLNIYMLQSLRLLIFSIHISFQGGGAPGSLSTRSEWKLIFGRWSLRGVGVEVEVELLFCARSLIFKQLEAGLWGDTHWWGDTHRFDKIVRSKKLTFWCPVV